MVLTYRQISVDTGRLTNGSILFDAAPYVSGCVRVTDIPEKQLIRWLMLSEPARGLIFEELGFPSSAFYALEVGEPFYSPGIGDLDLVLCNHCAPHEAAVLECKRVKIVVVDPEQHQMNKLEDTRIGVIQANRLHDKFGFSRTYLAVLTEVEASQQHDTNIPCRGIDSTATPDYGQTKSFKRIVEFPGRDDLKTDIGIVFIEVVQPSRISINERVTIRVCVHHPAQQRTQSDSVTNRIEMVMRGQRLANTC